MIGVIDVEIQAANPQMPLYPLRAFVNSPSSVRVRNVPTEIGAWKITSVRVAVAYPDSSIKTADCVLAGGAWVATVTGCAVSGTTENGFTVFAGGVDENGNAVANYVLGKGDVEVLKADGTLSPDAPAYYVHLLEEEPDAPNEGDMWPTAAGFVIWQDGEARALGGGSSVSVVPPSPSAQAGQAADAKATGDALWTGFTEWEFSGSGYDPSTTYLVTIDEYEVEGETLYIASLGGDETVEVDSPDVTSITFSGSNITATRHLITPTKTSQLTNDGAPNGGGNAYVMTNDTRLTNGSDPLAPADIGAASFADLSYALVTPGEWEFSDGGTHVITGPTGVGGVWFYSSGPRHLSNTFSSEAAALSALELTFTDHSTSDPFDPFTATRASLPGHLCDRANNLIDATSGNVTLTLPEYQAGKLRDLLVYVDLGDDGTDPYSITFYFPSGESNTGFKAEGDDPASATFPAPTAAGEWWYSFTECKPHKFAVSLKKVNTVAQGGA